MLRRRALDGCQLIKKQQLIAIYLLLSYEQSESLRQTFLRRCNLPNSLPSSTLHNRCTTALSPRLDGTSSTMLEETPLPNSTHLSLEPPSVLHPRTSLEASPPASRAGRPPSYTSTALQQVLPINPPFRASEHASDGKKHLLLAASGSVATIKLPNILRSLSTHPALSIKVILTAAAVQFLSGVSAEQPTVASLLSIPNVDAVYTDQDEWVQPWTRGAPILHIELRKCLS